MNGLQPNRKAEKTFEKCSSAEHFSAYHVQHRAKERR